MFSLVVFDLDGTLIDSIGDLWKAVNQLVTAHGGRRLSGDEVARMVGEGARLLVGRAIAASGATIGLEEALPRFLEIYDALLPGDTLPYQGIPEVLQRVGPLVTLAVLTNKPTEATRKILDARRLSHHFAQVIGGDGPFPRKPNPDALLHLVSAAGAQRATTLLVGDSTIDVRTAHNAGTRLCVAGYGFGRVTFDPAALQGDEFFVDRPQDLVAIIRGGPHVGPKP